jgi:hypothetical protein
MAGILTTLFVRPSEKEVKSEEADKQDFEAVNREGATYNAITAPSNSGPRPVLIVVGENAFQIILSQTLVAMKSDIPLPKP